MINTTEIVRNITDLPVAKRLAIIENLLQSVKNDTLKQLDSKEINEIKVFYQTFLLNNETLALKTILNQITESEQSITRGDKKINPTALFGIWENKPRSIQEIRQQDWKRNWD